MAIHRKQSGPVQSDVSSSRRGQSRAEGRRRWRKLSQQIADGWLGPMLHRAMQSLLQDKGSRHQRDSERPRRLRLAVAELSRAKEGIKKKSGGGEAARWKEDAPVQDGHGEGMCWPPVCTRRSRYQGLPRQKDPPKNNGGPPIEQSPVRVRGLEDPPPPHGPLKQVRNRYIVQQLTGCYKFAPLLVRMGSTCT